MADQPYQLTQDGVYGQSGGLYTAPDAIPDSVILQPASDDLSHFNGDTVDYDINSNSPVFDPSLSFKYPSISNSDSSDSFVASLSGLPDYPSVGYTHSFFFHPQPDTGDGSEIGPPNGRVLFGHDSDTQISNGYVVIFEEGDFKLGRYDYDGSLSLATLDSASGVIVNGFNAAEILHESNGDLTATLYDARGQTAESYRDGDVLSELSANDSTHLTDGSYDANGIGMWTSRVAQEVLDLWRTESNIATDGGVTITEKSSSQLTSKADWQGRPVLEDLSNGDWVMAYRDGSNHSSDDEVWHIRFSDDQGQTWTADDTDLSGSSVTGFPANPEDSASDMIFIELSNGDLLAHLDIRNWSNSTRNGIVQMRSTDGGSTWTDEGKINVAGATNDELVGAQDHFVHPDTGDIYISFFVDPGADLSMPYKSGIGRSTDDGSTWTYLSDISTTSDGTNETGIEYLGNDEILAVLRDDDETVTYQAKSTDLGSSWGSLNTILDDVSGAFQRPRIRSDGLLTGGTYTDGVLWMVGRIRPGEDIVITWSDDDGSSWATPHVFGTYDDAAYSDLLHRTGSEYYLATYHGTTSAADVYDYVYTVD